jgi:hypothetical protein
MTQTMMECNMFVKVHDLFCYLFNYIVVIRAIV